MKKKLDKFIKYFLTIVIVTTYTNMRNSAFAILINKIFKAYWFVTRPTTKGVKGIIFNKKGEVLMVRLIYYPKTWTFPGGGVHKKESSYTAVIRECAEEVSIKLQKPEYIGDLYFEYEYKKDTVSVYREIIDSQEIQIDGREVSEARWYETSNLPSNIGKNAQIIFDFANKNIK